MRERLAAGGLTSAHTTTTRLFFSSKKPIQIKGKGFDELLLFLGIEFTVVIR